jgi:hypothetical protein
MSLWANIYLVNRLSGQMSFWANVFWANVFLGKCPSGQTSSGQMSFCANVLLGKRLLGKCLPGKWLSGQMAFWANVLLGHGQTLYGQMSLGKCLWANVMEPLSCTLYETQNV